MNKWDDVDIDNIEPMEMTQLEKKRIEHHVKQHAPKKKMNPLKKGIAAAAIAGVTIVGAGFASPTIASQLPFMENIVSYFAEKDVSHESKQLHGKEVHAVAHTDDATIFVDRAVFDGQTATIYYGIELTEPTDAASVYLSDMARAKGANGMSGTSYVERIDDRHFVGVDTVTVLDTEKQAEDLSIDWTIHELAFMTDDAIQEQTLKGKWKLAFDLEAEEVVEVPLREKTEASGVTVQMQSLQRSDVSTTLRYFVTATDEARDRAPKMKGVAIGSDGREEAVETEAIISTTLAIRDDLGNEYTIDAGGGTQEGDGPLYEIATFRPIDPNAKQLTLELRIDEWDEAMQPITIDLTKLNE